MNRPTCPYLGLEEDPTTFLNFTSEGNFCHNARPPTPVASDHQQRYCLTGAHIDCPVYQSKEPRPMPAALAAPAYRRSRARRTLALLGIPVLAVTLTALGILLSMFAGRISGLQSGLIPQSGPGGNEGLGGLFFPGERTESTGPFFELTPPAEQAVTNCEMLPGWEPYVVNPTDSLFRLSVVFGVSVEALQVANCMGDSTVILPGQVIYVPSLPTETAGGIVEGDQNTQGDQQPILPTVQAPVAVNPFEPPSNPEPVSPNPQIPTSTPQPPPQPTAQPTNTNTVRPTSPVVPTLTSSPVMTSIPPTPITPSPSPTRRRPTRTSFPTVTRTPTRTLEPSQIPTTETPPTTPTTEIPPTTVVPTDTPIPPTDTPEPTEETPSPEPPDTPTPPDPTETDPPTSPP
ncbi:MAG: LysM peptidoglycan-binding domain-containing protein, partial [Chloroflexi bacterium]|nr:LysM peptidoglycan-binding domain-containing protein [Chloroflexota bacterium]